MAKRFQKKKEDFTCENCGTVVTGNGYTNHCPKCLWGKHVDINPGDRAEVCGGSMKPIGWTRKKADEYRVTHRCTVCGITRNNTLSPNDDMDVIIKLPQTITKA